MSDFRNYTQLLNELTSPIYVKDENHLWVYVNQAFCDLLNKPKEYLIGKSDYDTTPKEQADIFWEKDNEVLTSKTKNINIETTTNGQGETVWVESKKSYFENEKGEKFIFGILTDITLLKEREFELEEAWESAKSADLAKSQFLANMSHEVRTPMNGIMGMADILDRGELSPQQKDFVGVIIRSGQALLTIINDILDFSKIEAGQMLIDPNPFTLRDCIEDVMALLSPGIVESEIDMLLRIQPDLPKNYIGDVGRIRQILTNVIGNAVKFTHKGHVYIDVSGETNELDIALTFSIEDTGIGISENKLESIFDKFNQADISTTREFGGTGLGLNIARELVRLMGGELKVESQEGLGSRFSFTINLPRHNVELSPPLNTQSLQNLKVLVVDDNPTNRMILTEQLKHWGCKPLAVASADLGIAVLSKAAQKNLKFDVVITDYQMPKKNGEDFVRMFKTSEALEYVPFIMLSSVDRTELKIRMTGLGVETFLTKPTRASELKKAISHAHYSKSPYVPKVSIPTKEPAKADNSITNAFNFTQSSIDILIAEDNEINSAYISYLMQELGLNFTIMSNGKQAVKAWRETDPKIILMDLSMPQMNGFQATANIRAEEKENSKPRTPIIALTAHALSGDKENCLEHDMDDYLTKPISLANLQACLEKWNIFPATELKKKL